MPAVRTVAEIETELTQVRTEITRVLTASNRPEKIGVIQENFGEKVYAYEDRARILTVLYAREAALVQELAQAEAAENTGGRRGIGIQYGIFRALLLCLLLASPAFAELTQDSFDVAATSTTVFAASNRFFLALQNDSDTTIYCKVDGSTAVVGQGLRLGSSGGSAWWDVDKSVPRAAINCIHGGTGNKTLQGVEVQ